MNRVYYSDIELYDLFRLRDCLNMLKDMGFANRYNIFCLNNINEEITRRANETNQNKRAAVVPKTPR